MDTESQSQNLTERYMDMQNLAYSNLYPENSSEEAGEELLSASTSLGEYIQQFESSKKIKNVFNVNLAVAMIRVSSKEQSNGFSLDAQKSLLQEYMKKNGLECVKIFEFHESAGRHKRRTQFENVITYIRENHIRNLILEKTDRAYRNWGDLHRLEDLRLNGDLVMHLVKEGVILDDNTSSHENTMHAVKVLFGKQFLDNLSEEVAKGFKAKAEKGINPGSPPFGYICNPETKKLEKHPENSKLVKRIFEEFANYQYTTREIAGRLNKEGYKTPMNRVYRDGSITTILRRSTYYGAFIYRGEIHKGIHEPIIDIELFDRCQERFSKKRRVRKPHKEPKATEFLFKDLLYSKKGQRIRCMPRKQICLNKNGQKRKLYMPSYFFRKHEDIPYNNKRVSFSEKKLLKALDEAISSINWSEKKSEQARSQHNLVDDKGVLQKNLSDLHTRLHKLSKHKESYIDLLLEKEITQEEFTSKRSGLQVEIDKLRFEIKIAKDLTRRVKPQMLSTIDRFDRLYESYQSSRAKIEKAEILKQFIGKIEVSHNRELNLLIRAPFRIFVQHPSPVSL